MANQVAGSQTKLAADVEALNSKLRLHKTLTKVYLSQLTWRSSGTMYYANATVPNHIIATMQDFGTVPSGLIITMYDLSESQVQFFASANSFSENAMIVVNIYSYGN